MLCSQVDSLCAGFHREGGAPWDFTPPAKVSPPQNFGKNISYHLLMFHYTHCGFNNMMLAVKNCARMHLRTPISQNFPGGACPQTPLVGACPLSPPQHKFLYETLLWIQPTVSLSLSLCLSVCLSACLSLCLSVCLSACLPVSLSLSLSVCLSVSLSVRLSVCLPPGSMSRVASPRWLWTAFTWTWARSLSRSSRSGGCRYTVSAAA